MTRPMTRKLAAWREVLFLGALGASVMACGGEIVGFGNDGNRITANGTLEEVAEALAEHSETPRITDEVLAEIFSAIVGRARQGDPEAALIVLQVAQHQREADE